MTILLLEMLVSLFQQQLTSSGNELDGSTFKTSLLVNTILGDDKYPTWPKKVCIAVRFFSDPKPSAPFIKAWLRSRGLGLK